MVLRENRPPDGVLILSTAKIIPAIHRTRGTAYNKNRQTRPAGLFSGYYRDEALRRSFWNNGVYDTVGDVVYMDEDGYLWLVGRSDNAVKGSGYRKSDLLKLKVL